MAKCRKQLPVALRGQKNNPDCVYTGTIPTDRALACKNAAEALGKAMYALEVILTQSSLFPTAKDLSIAADAAYNVQHLTLQSRCRVHGCPEVAYKHG